MGHAESWFYNQILYPRAIRAFLTVYGAYLVLFLVGAGFCQLNVLHPWDSLIDFLVSCCSVGALLCGAAAAAFFCAANVALLLMLDVGYPVSGARIVQISRLIIQFWPIVFVISVLVEFLVNWRLFMAAAGSSFGDWIEVAKGARPTVSVRHTFGLISALVTAVYTAVAVFVRGDYCYSLKTAPKLSSKAEILEFLRTRGIPAFKKIFVQSSILVFGCWLVFLFVGHFVLMRNLTTYFGLPTSYEGLLDYIWQLTSPELVASCMVFSLLVQTAQWLVLVVVPSVIASPCKFPLIDLGGDVIDPRVVYLHTAMAADSSRLLKYHAYQDLHEMSMGKDGRLANLFALSIPGGHPRNWTAVLAQCQSTLETLMDALRGKHHQLILRQSRTLNGRLPVPPGGKALMNCPPHLRLLMDNYKSEQKSKDQKVSSPEGLVMRIQNELHQSVLMAVRRVSRSRFVAYFLEESIEFGLGEILLDLDLPLWTISSVVNFCCAAFKRDRYGVVQRDLAGIVSQLADLMLALEKLCRVSGGFPPKPSGTLTNQLKYELYAQLDLSLRQLADTYGSSLRTLNLNVEQSSVFKPLLVAGQEMYILQGE